MINIIRFKEFLAELKAEVNSALIANDADFAGQIGDVILSPTESHLIKKIKDKSGIVLAVKMADSDTEIDSVDNFSEHDHELLFILEKIDPASQSDDVEAETYAKLQTIMAEVKANIMDKGLNGTICGDEEKLSKPFKTEWEYQVFGGFNGLSVSFDLQNFRL